MNAAIERVRQEEGLGVSQAVNRLIRGGLLAMAQVERSPFTQRTQRLGIKIDVSNVADAIDVLEGPLAG